MLTEAAWAGRAGPRGAGWAAGVSTALGSLFECIRLRKALAPSLSKLQFNSVPRVGWAGQECRFAQLSSWSQACPRGPLERSAGPELGVQSSLPKRKLLSPDLPVPLLGTAPPHPGSHTALPLLKGTEERSHSGCDRACGLMNTRVRFEAGARRASAPGGDLLPHPQELHAARKPSAGGVRSSSPSSPHGRMWCLCDPIAGGGFDPDSALCGIDRHPGSGVQRPGFRTRSLQKPAWAPLPVCAARVAAASQLR